MSTSDKYVMAVVSYETAKRIREHNEKFNHEVLIVENPAIKDTLHPCRYHLIANVANTKYVFGRSTETGVEMWHENHTLYDMHCPKPSPFEGIDDLDQIIDQQESLVR